MTETLNLRKRILDYENKKNGCERVYCKREPLHDLISVKLLSNEKIVVSSYKKIPRPQYKWFSPMKKQFIPTGELFDFNLSDIKKKIVSEKNSLARTLKNVHDISSLNDFRYFLTITFNKAFVDRASAVDVHKTFKKIIRRFKYYYGGVSYLQLGEFHNDLVSIHYHILINFDTEPKLRFYEKSYSGRSLYRLDSIVDKRYKKSVVKKHLGFDCMLVFEKLEGVNNIGYLTKYLTKGHLFPLTRRFGATRDLKRTRVVSRAVFGNGFDIIEDFKNRYAFETTFKNDNVSVMECECIYTTTSILSRGAERPDLSMNNTKGEIQLGGLYDCFPLSDLFNKIVHSLRISHDIMTKRHEKHESESFNDWFNRVSSLVVRRKNCFRFSSYGKILPFEV